MLTFGINSGAYVAEIFRGGIESIPKGQYEAGQVLGMTRRETFFKVILLQVIKRIIAPMSNEIITLVKLFEICFKLFLGIFRNARI